MGENKIKQIIRTIFDKIFYEYEPVLGIVFICIIVYLRHSQDKELLKYIFESNDAESQSIEYLRFNNKLAEKVKEICIPFQMLLLKIVEDNVSNYQPGKLLSFREGERKNFFIKD